MHPETRPLRDPRADRRTPTPLVEDLLRAGQQGDRDRFDELFDLWLEAVFARASASQRERQAAEEITRRVMLDAVRAAASGL
jgi:hypothetical protein